MSRTLKTAAVALAAFALPVFAAGSAAPQQHGLSPAAAEAQIGKTVSADLLNALDQASRDGLGLAVTPNPFNLKAIDGPRVGDGDKVGLLYMGANFCPYCAGQRWVLVLTLLRFGKFDGLAYMMSSPKDAFPDTATFSFEKATYASDYIDFVPVETADREGRKLMEPTKAQNEIYTKFDAPPYTPVFGGIPFVYVDGQYVLTRPMLSPADITGKDWRTVVRELSNQQSSLFQSVMPQVNSLTAALCRLDGGNPDDVCSATGVTAANGALLGLSPTH